MIYHHRHQYDDDLMVMTAIASLSEEKCGHAFVVLDYDDDVVVGLGVAVPATVGNGRRMIFSL